MFNNASLLTPVMSKIVNPVFLVLIPNCVTKLGSMRRPKLGGWFISTHQSTHQRAKTLSLTYSLQVHNIFNASVLTQQSVMSENTVPVLVLYLLLLLIPQASPLSFDVNPITNSNITLFNLKGDASIDDQGIQIPPNNQSAASRMGRATFKEPLHLWDTETGKLSDFSTHFSFIINSNGSDSFADGLAFFNGAACFGLGDISSSPSLSSLESFVAVKFDTFMNTFDPFFDNSSWSTFTAVGININNMTTVNASRWENDVRRGFKNDAWINYDSVSKMLIVEFTGKIGGTTQRGIISYEVDLRDYLPEYVMVGFSAATGAWFEQNLIKSWNFSSTLQQESPPSPPPPPVIVRRKKKGLIYGLSIGLSVFIFATALAIFVVWKKKKMYEVSKEEDRMDNELGEGTGPRKFSYSELVAATDNFAEDRKLGEGGFGCVYKGFLTSTSTYIAVKRVSEGSKQGRKEYAAEVKIISQLRHKNLVQLIGWCHQRSVLLLVYEFMPNKSLDSHIFNKFNSIVIMWEMRYRIAHGLASALLYLHEELRQCVVHRDIKASNIMLDDNFNAKLGDFGLARLVDHDKDPQTTIPAGTIGYMAPEYPTTGKASKETDIYSFGIVLLEIACGRRPIDYKFPKNQILLVEWVWSLYGGGKLLDGADPKLESSEDDVDKIERLMIVGLWCVHPDSRQRPSIRKVVKVLDCESPLPVLARSMPKPMYDTLGQWRS